jgi:hypothetical protein
VPAARRAAEKLLLADQYAVTTPAGYYTGSLSAGRFLRFQVGGQVVPAESLQARYERPDLDGPPQRLPGRDGAPGAPVREAEGW